MRCATAAGQPARLVKHLPLVELPRLAEELSVHRLEVQKKSFLRALRHVVQMEILSACTSCSA
eukprot:1961792-Pyramimonas_sp.AAC.1